MPERVASGKFTRQPETLQDQREALSTFIEKRQILYTAVGTTGTIILNGNNTIEQIIKVGRIRSRVDASLKRGMHHLVSVDEQITQREDKLIDRAKAYLGERARQSTLMSEFEKVSEHIPDEIALAVRTRYQELLTRADRNPDLAWGVQRYLGQQEASVATSKLNQANQLGTESKATVTPLKPEVQDRRPASSPEINTEQLAEFVDLLGQIYAGQTAEILVSGPKLKVFKEGLRLAGIAANRQVEIKYLRGHAFVSWTDTQDQDTHPVIVEPDPNPVDKPADIDQEGSASPKENRVTMRRPTLTPEVLSYPITELTQAQANIGHRGLELIEQDGMVIVRYLSLEELRDRAYEWIIKGSARAGRPLQGILDAQRLFEKDLPQVAEEIAKARRVAPSRRPERLGSVLRAIEKSPLLSQLDNETLIDVLYRNITNLTTLERQEDGSTIVLPYLEAGMPKVSSEKVARGPQGLIIPTDNLELNPQELEIRAPEIYAITGVLLQIGQNGLQRYGITLDQTRFKALERINKGVESAKGSLREPQAVMQIFAKLRLIAEKGHMAPFTNRSNSLSAIADIFEGVEEGVIRELLSENSLNITFHAKR